jgi:hypothetical protein
MNYLSYRLSLNKLYRKRNRIDKYYKKQYEEAKKEKNSKKREEISSYASMELNVIDDDIFYLEHRYLTSVATRLLLSIPPFVSEEKGGLWEQSQLTGKWHLTSEGIRKLRGEIRTEKKERTDLLSRWIAIIIGLIGAITGLVAVIKD